MRINKKTATLTFANLFISGWGASTSLFADSFDDTVNTLKKQGYDVNVETKRQDIYNKNEYNELLSIENDRRSDELTRLRTEISKFEDDKRKFQDFINDDKSRINNLNSDYEKLLARYKEDVKMINAEREKLTREHEESIRIKKETDARRQANEEKYKKEMEVYNSKLADYKAQVAKLEADYDKALNTYDRELSAYKERLMNHENKKKEIEAANKKLEDDYNKEKERVRLENEKRKSEFLADQNKKQKEYETALKKWNDDKAKVESTVKTKELTDGKIEAKIAELIKKGVTVNKGKEEIVEVDGTSGKPTEAEAIKKLNELVDGKLAELDRIEKNKVIPKPGAAELSEEEYNKKLEEFKKNVDKHNDYIDKIDKPSTLLHDDYPDVFDNSKALYKNKTMMKVIETKGNVTFYEGKFTGDDDYPYIYWVNTGSPRNKDWVESSTFKLGKMGGLEYSRVKLAKGASITYEYTIKDGDEFKNGDDKRFVAYKVVNGEKVKSDIKKIRITITNNGSIETNGDGIFYLINNIASVVGVVYNPSNMERVYSKADVLDISNKYNTPVFNYNLKHEFLDKNSDKLYLTGNKLSYNGNSVVQDPTNKDIITYNGLIDSDRLDANGFKVKDTVQVVGKKPDWFDSSEEVKIIDKAITTNANHTEEISSVIKYSSRSLYSSTARRVNGFVEAESDGVFMDFKSSPPFDKPTFNYTRKNVPATVNPVKVLYKYKESFVTPKPTNSGVKPNSDVELLPEPKKPTAKDVPVLTEKEKTPPTQPNKPTLPNKPIEPNKPPFIEEKYVWNLSLPELPKEPEKPNTTSSKDTVLNRLFKVTKLEYNYVPTTYFEDEGGNQIIPREPGDKEKREFPNWKYIKTTTDKDGNRHHIYTKVKKVNRLSNLFVNHYKEGTTEKLAETEEYRDHLIGSDYKTKAQTIKPRVINENGKLFVINYELVGFPNNKDGKYTEQDTVVNYYYKEFRTELKVSSSNSLQLKNKLASWGNSLTLRKFK